MCLRQWCEIGCHTTVLEENGCVHGKLLKLKLPCPCIMHRPFSKSPRLSTRAETPHRATSLPPAPMNPARNPAPRHHPASQQVTHQPSTKVLFTNVFCSRIKFLGIFNLPLFSRNHLPEQLTRRSLPGWVMSGLAVLTPDALQAGYSRAMLTSYRLKPAAFRCSFSVQ